MGGKAQQVDTLVDGHYHRAPVPPQMAVATAGLAMRGNGGGKNDFPS